MIRKKFQIFITTSHHQQWTQVSWMSTIMTHKTSSLIRKITQDSLFYLIYFCCIPLCLQCMWSFPRRFSLVSIQWYCAWYAHTREGVVGSCRFRNILRGCEREIILARNLLRQSKAWSRVPVRFQVPQGTRETRSSDHAVVRPFDHDCYLVVDPTT